MHKLVKAVHIKATFNKLVHDFQCPQGCGRLSVIAGKDATSIYQNGLSKLLQVMMGLGQHAQVVGHHYAGRMLQKAAPDTVSALEPSASRRRH